MGNFVSPWWFMYRFAAFVHDAGALRGPDGDVLPVVAFSQIRHLQTDEGGSQMRYERRDRMIKEVYNKKDTQLYRKY